MENERFHDDNASEESRIKRAIDAAGAAGSKPTETQTFQDKIPDAGIPKRIGQYRIKRAIASGGMGTVYEAVQEKPRRTVAVKLMRAGIASRSALRRFEYESQLLARLRHNGIAQVYDAGTHRDGDVTVPYFAMEYIVGAKPITEYVVQEKLGTRERMKLFSEVCQAVQHGHQKGIIHRDLKPSNILVDSSGQVKIIDFGVARSTDSDMAVTTLQTDVGQLIGTLQYMSPEQCAADPHDIDTRSDVYALGVILFEMLCQQLPYDLKGAAIHEATRVIREQEPTKLSSYNKTLRGDVETITFKALEKNRNRRYQSASALIADIGRYLSGEAISARPPSVTYQLQVFARRNKGLFTAVAAVFVVLVIGAAVSTSLYIKADAARVQAEIARTEAEQLADFQSQMLMQIDPTTAGVRLAADLNRRFHEALERAGMSADERAARADEFRANLRRLNATDTAMALIDEAVLRPAVAAMDRQFGDQPLVDARLRQVMAIRYRDLGLYDAALPLQESALETRKSKLGEEHEDTLESMNQYVELLLHTGRYDEAEVIASKAMATARRVLGEERLVTLNLINSMGAVLMSSGRYEEAEVYTREAIAKCRRVLGNEHPLTLDILNNMGVLLGNVGRLDEAETYLQEAAGTKRRVLGEEDPKTLLSIAGMGNLLQSMGRLDEAEDYYRESLEKFRRVLGEDHPYTIVTSNNLGDLLRELSRHDEAEVYVRWCLEASRRVNGAQHPNTIALVGNLGRLLAELGRHDEAIAIMAPVEFDTRKTFTGGTAYRVARLLTALGRARAGLGYDADRFALAESNLLEAHKLYVETYGKTHKETLESVRGLVNLYAAWHVAAPDKDFDAKAAEWQAKLPGPETEKP